MPRFVLHQLALPWIIYAAYDQARQAGQGWAQRPASRWIAVAVSAAVMVAGIATRLWALHLEPEIMDGVLRYVAIGVAGPPIVSIVSIGLVTIGGLVFWRQQRWPWIFLADRRGLHWRVAAQREPASGDGQRAGGGVYGRALCHAA